MFVVDCLPDAGSAGCRASRVSRIRCAERNAMGVSVEPGRSHPALSATDGLAECSVPGLPMARGEDPRRDLLAGSGDLAAVDALRLGAESAARVGVPRIGILRHFKDDAHSLAVGFIAQIR